MDEDGCGMDNPQEKSVRVCGYAGIQPMDPDNAEIDGNSFRARNKIPIPAQYGKSNHGAFSGPDGV